MSADDRPWGDEVRTQLKRLSASVDEALRRDAEYQRLINEYVVAHALYYGTADDPRFFAAREALVAHHRRGPTA